MVLSLRRIVGVRLLMFLVSLFAGLLALFNAPPAYAATATWKDQYTITYNGVDFRGPTTQKLTVFGTDGASTQVDFRQVFTIATGNTVLFFRDDVNMNTARQVAVNNIRSAEGATIVSLTNLRTSVPTGVPPASTGTTPTASPDTCTIDGVGWIVCPVANFLSEVTDGAYMIVENLLVFRFANNAFDTNNTVYKIWSNIRNLANIAFIFVFFAIIFSQTTSIGIGNYGIKKMLPRLIVAAILVNLSYFICVFAVDVSNVIGAGIDGIISSVPLSDVAEEQDTWKEVISGLLAGGAAAAALGVGAAVGGLTLSAALAGALPFLVIALFAVVTALVVLVARQALLIILIVLAPLAFVAYVLPNTEDTFNKWRKLFTTLLVFYPLVAIIFSGSKVAASVLRETTSGGTGVLIQVMSLAVQAFPLFALPFLLKFSGGLLGRIAGAINNPNKGPFDKLRKSAERKRDVAQANARERNLKPINYSGKRLAGARKRFAESPFSAQSGARRRVDNAEELKRAQDRESRTASSYYANRIVTDDDYANKMAGGNNVPLPLIGRDADHQELLRVRTAAQAAEKNAFNERVKQYQTSFSLSKEGADTGDAYELDPSGNRRRDASGRFILKPGTADNPNPGFLERQFNEAIQTNNIEQASAVLNRMSGLGAGGREAVRRAMERNTITSPDMQLAISNSIYEDNFGSLVTKVGDVAKGKFDKNGKWDMATSIRNLGTEQLATQDMSTLLKYEGIIKPSEAHRIVTDTELQSKVQSDEHLDIFKRVAANYTPPPPDASAAPAGGGNAPSGSGPSAGSGPGGSPSPAPASGGGSSGGNSGAASTAAAAAAGAAAGAAAASAFANKAPQSGPGLFDAYSVSDIQQLNANAIRTHAGNAGGVTSLDSRDLNKIVDALSSSGARNPDQDQLLQELTREQGSRASNEQNTAYNTYTNNVQTTQKREQDEAFGSYTGNLRVTRDREQDEFRTVYKDILNPPNQPPRRNDDNDKT